MFVFLIRRIIQAVSVMLVISLLAFSISNNFGDPLRELVGQSVSVEQRNLLRDKMGLNDSFITRYSRFLIKAVHGDFGNSYFFKKPALKTITDKFFATFELVIGASFIIIVFSVPCGVFCAIKPKHILTKMIMFLSVIGISVPVFITAIILIWIFAIYFNVMPSFGRGEIAPLFGFLWQSNFATWDGFKHLILPSISLASIMLPLFIRLIRAEMMEVLQSEYIKFARAKGLSLKRIYFIHALKNTMLPVITVGGVQLGTMVAYTILTETIFQWTGMGFLFLEAVNRVDTPLIIAYLIVVGFIFVVTNTIIDLLYILINPTVNLVSKK